MAVAPAPAGRKFLQAGPERFRARRPAGRGAPRPARALRCRLRCLSGGALHRRAGASTSGGDARSRPPRECERRDASNPSILGPSPERKLAADPVALFPRRLHLNGEATRLLAIRARPCARPARFWGLTLRNRRAEVKREARDLRREAARPGAAQPRDQGARRALRSTSWITRSMGMIGKGTERSER